MKRFMYVLACLFMIIGSATAQNRKVTGVVTDAAEGKPMPGVRVFVNKTSIGTVTDAKGVFQLSVPSHHKMLTFAAIGYITQELPARSTMEIRMRTNEKLLDQAIVVAYGTAKTPLPAKLPVCSGAPRQEPPTTAVMQDPAARLLSASAASAQ